MVQGLLEVDWGCVIIDESHRARRRTLPKPDERGPRLGNPDTEANRLYAFAWKLALRTRSMLLGTATPVQMHPIEAWDLLRLLSQGNEHVLGGIGSRWLTPDAALPYLLGELDPPTESSELWPWLKNPLPPRWEDLGARNLRSKLHLGDESALATISWEDLPGTARAAAEPLCANLFERHNPFLRSIVRRTRKYLESTTNPATGEKYLKPVAVELFGEEDPVPLAGYLFDAYQKAEEFCKLLGARVNTAGFFKTLLLRRIGSSIEAGRSTVEKMLNQ